MNTSTDDTTMTPAWANHGSSPKEITPASVARDAWMNPGEHLKDTDAHWNAITQTAISAFLAQAKGPTDEEIKKALASCSWLSYRHSVPVIRALFTAAHAAEMAEAMREAEMLASSLWRRYFQSESPDWKPLPTIAGIISQIDNMVAGIIGIGEQVPWNLGVAMRETDALKSSLATAERERRVSEGCLAILEVRMKEKCQQLVFAEDAAKKGDLARQNAAGMEMEIKELRERVVEMEKEAHNKEVESYGPPGFNEYLDERNILGKQPIFTLPSGASLDPSKHLTPDSPPSTPGPS